MASERHDETRVERRLGYLFLETPDDHDFRLSRQAGTVLHVIGWGTLMLLLGLVVVALWTRVPQTVSLEGRLEAADRFGGSLPTGHGAPLVVGLRARVTLASGASPAVPATVSSVGPAAAEGVSVTLHLDTSAGAPPGTPGVADVVVGEVSLLRDVLVGKVLRRR